jgi:hypothetical protein
MVESGDRLPALAISLVRPQTVPPKVLPIDVGRQFRIDDFLIAHTSLTRTHHRPEYHPRGSVLTDGMVYSDGVWYDPADRLFKMWYMTRGGTVQELLGDSRGQGDRCSRGANSHPISPRKRSAPTCGR